MKLVVVLDHKTKHDLENPTNTQLRAFGHSIVDLYDQSKMRAIERNLPSHGWFSREQLEHDILVFLSEFATGSRYYNLDQLAGSAAKADEPLAKWFRVQMAIADVNLPQSKRNTVMQLARNHCDKFKLYGWELGPSGEYELVSDVTYQVEVLRRTRGHCVWTIIKILRPFHNLLDKLCNEIHEIEVSKGIGTPTVPYITEFVLFFLCDRQTSIRRKKWMMHYPR